MPETDGGEVAAQIQADPELQRTPIIFSPHLSRKLKQDWPAFGHPFLAKPISIPELIKGIEEILPAHPAF
jgi:CheY-like chemotaxis protein